MGRTPLEGCVGFISNKKFSNFCFHMKDFKWGRNCIFINPISGKVWNDIITRAWVNLTCKWFRQHKYPKRPHIGHNLFLATYFDIFLAIESKISSKMSIFLMLLAPIWEWSKLTFFKPKIIKSSYFEFQKSYIPQRKLKTYEIRIQLEKIRINARNFKKFNFFQFSWHAQGPKKIQSSVFQESWK